ncbi:hypothetical protein BQ8482_340096 [Mesorhizobium delmotii]|uniref:HTH cro/C1-type domain-containing protein n=1 Tax=Mesorhizobium delmotii TaxID=1631247 RepID=A0A2P9APV8_9HYPH|nr:hypothetical protein BQ8482_340096 [Mesorhizobium delmotii]
MRCARWALRPARRSNCSAVRRTNLRLPRLVMSTGPRNAASTTSPDLLPRSVRVKLAIMTSFITPKIGELAVFSNSLFIGDLAGRECSEGLRVHRGPPARDLAAAVDLSAPHISEIERKKKEGSFSAMKKIAAALNAGLPIYHPAIRDGARETYSQSQNGLRPSRWASQREMPISLS